MRFNFRAKLGNLTFFAMISSTQTLEGITSYIEKDKHIILWDLEKNDLKTVRNNLKPVQLDHDLGDIFFVSDMKDSYRAFCFSQRSWKEYLKILLETEGLDYQFFYYTVRRGKSTLRICDKEGRDPQKVVSVLEGFEDTEIPKKVIHVIYDTGIEKRGTVISLGEKKI